MVIETEPTLRVGFEEIKVKPERCRPISDPAYPEQFLGFAVVLRAIADRAIYAKELSNLPSWRWKRARTLRNELIEIDRFISDDMDRWCGPNMANIIRENIESISIERVLEILEGIASQRSI